MRFSELLYHIFVFKLHCKYYRQTKNANLARWARLYAYAQHLSEHSDELSGIGTALHTAYPAALFPPRGYYRAEIPLHGACANAYFIRDDGIDAAYRSRGFNHQLNSPYEIRVSPVVRPKSII